MHVVATAGHVDHGKSTLVRVLTGTDPDRYAEEKRRGLTIDLGYAWTTLPGGDTVAFVDVPGHERFIATMLAGLGPAPAVLFVVAADQGWGRQSAEHLAAVDALGLTHGLLVITRSDLADPAPATRQARSELASSTLRDVPVVAVSAVTGGGLVELRAALAGLTSRLPAPVTDGRIRLWVDRCFSISGAGTVVTGTLGAGTLTPGEQLALGDRLLTVRGLQSLDEPCPQVSAVARVAVNLRGIEADAVRRGDALCTPAAWRHTAVLDVECRDPAELVAELPARLLVHLGTAAVPAHVRPLDGSMVRLTLDRPLPVQREDRLVLRDAGRHLLAGATVLDVDPPPLRRRGAARARATELQRWSADPATVLPDLVRRRGAVRRSELTPLGVPVGRGALELIEVGEWWVDPGTWSDWQTGVRGAVQAQATAHPLDPRLSLDAAARAVQIPDRKLVPAVAEASGLVVSDGWVAAPDATGLGPAEAAVRRLEERLRARPFAVPEHDELVAWGLGRAELAAAERTGRIVRLDTEIVVLPSGPALAMRTLAALNQPFTLSEARKALGTTRRVAVPLLHLLDGRGWTRRIDANRREVRARGGVGA